MMWVPKLQQIQYLQMSAGVTNCYRERAPLLFPPDQSIEGLPCPPFPQLVLPRSSDPEWKSKQQLPLTCLDFQTQLQNCLSWGIIWFPLLFIIGQGPIKHLEQDSSFASLRSPISVDEPFKAIELSVGPVTASVNQGNWRASGSPPQLNAAWKLPSCTRMPPVPVMNHHFRPGDPQKGKNTALVHRSENCFTDGQFLLQVFINFKGRKSFQSIQ